jgi:hypothetical protein
MPLATTHHAVRDHCLAPSRTAGAPPAAAGGKYGRLFPGLPALDVDEAFLQRLGGSGGACDGGPSGPDGGDDARVCRTSQS